MRIWVDADACPAIIKEVLFRAVQRTGIPLTLVANQPVRAPKSKLITAIRVAPGFDVADNEIVRRAAPGDLVVTSDIPLAAELLEKGAHALNPRGELYSTETIKQKLTLRDFMDTMRGSGIHTGGPAALGQVERKAFADALDRFLTASRK